MFKNIFDSKATRNNGLSIFEVSGIVHSQANCYVPCRFKSRLATSSEISWIRLIISRFGSKSV